MTYCGFPSASTVFDREVAEYGNNECVLYPALLAIAIVPLTCGVTILVVPNATAVCKVAYPAYWLPVPVGTATFVPENVAD